MTLTDTCTHTVPAHQPVVWKFLEVKDEKCIFIQFIKQIHFLSKKIYPKEGLFCKQKYLAIFCFIHFFALRISSSVSSFLYLPWGSVVPYIFFTSNVLLIQVYLRPGNSQRLVAVVFPVYKLCMIHFLRTGWIRSEHFYWSHVYTSLPSFSDSTLVVCLILVCLSVFVTCSSLNKKISK